MKQEVYDAVLNVLSREPSFQAGLLVLKQTYPKIVETVGEKTLRSIQAQYYVRRMRRFCHKHYSRKTKEAYYRLYKEAKSKKEEHVVSRLAAENDISPCLLARTILEEYYIHDLHHIGRVERVRGEGRSVCRGSSAKPTMKIGEGPCLKEKLLNQLVMEGQDMSMTVEVDTKGKPLDAIKFFRGTRELKDDSRVTIKMEGSTSTLHIKKCRPTDEAKYDVNVVSEGCVTDQATFLVFINVPPGFLSNCIRDIAKLPNPDLATEIHECILLDDFYGPVVDSIKRTSGAEYEIILRSDCLKAGLSFKSEDNMRDEGYDKTPDIKLNVPVLINNKVVNWIESKASFGDPITHQQYTIDQYLPYKNRFGPGAVIYWFGYVEELAKTTERGIILLDAFPQAGDIITMDDVHAGTKDTMAELNAEDLETGVDDDRFYNYVDPMFDSDDDELT